MNEKYNYYLYLKDEKVTVSIIIQECEKDFIDLELISAESSVNFHKLALSVTCAGRGIKYIVNHNSTSIRLIIPNIAKECVQVEYELPNNIFIGEKGKRVFCFNRKILYLYADWIFFFPKNTEKNFLMSYDGVDYSRSEVIVERNACYADSLCVNQVYSKGIQIRFCDVIYNKKSIYIIEKILNYFTDSVGIKNDFPIHIFILNGLFVCGGFCGKNSLISSNNIMILAHEFVHIWIGNRIRFLPESDWIKEGLTEYLSLKLLRESGIISDRDYSLILSDKERRFCNNNLPIINAISNKKKYSYNESHYIALYDGGMLFFCVMDLFLEKYTKGIECIIKEMNTLKKDITTSDFWTIISGIVNTYDYERLTQVMKMDEILLNNYI